MTKNKEESNETRATWQGGQFLLALIGYAVGIGNIWRFPYLCMRNGGGAFLVPYFLSMLLCGMPLFFLEACIGQFSSRSPSEVWSFCPLFKGLGWCMAALSGFVCIYYNIIITWVLYYLYESFSFKLPWATCDNSWNTLECLGYGHDQHSQHVPRNGTQRLWNNTESLAFSNVTNVVRNNESVSPAEQFWERGVLELSTGIEDLGGIKWKMLLFLALSWVLIFACLFKGVQSSGKVVYVTATAPYVFLAILLVRGVTLPGAMNGIRYFIVPDFSKLADIKVWTEASLQIFYSLGPGWGGIITMSSYNKFSNNCFRDALIVPVVNCGTSFFGGFVFFSVIGFMAHEAKLPVEDVVTSGPGLAFIVYPEAFIKMPISPVWSVCFFVMLLTIGLDTQFGMVETLLSSLIDSFPRLRKVKVLFTASVCLFLLFLGLPFVTRGGMYAFQLLDWYVGSFSLITISFIECIVVMWIYGHDRFFYDIECMIGYKPHRCWKVCLGGITPLILITITIYNMVAMGKPYYGDYFYPNWAIAIGWVIATSSFLPLPLFAVHEIVQHQGSFFEKIKASLRPRESWGPELKEHRKNYKYAKEYGIEDPMILASLTDSVGTV